MNINYYEKIKKKFILLNTKKKFTHRKCGSARKPAGRARKMNLILNYSASQPSRHFAGQNAGGPKWAELACFAIPRVNHIERRDNYCSSII